MTVKCLNEADKNFIAAAYREGVLDSEELAHMHNVSKRTINRVCVELGVNKIRHYKPRPKDAQLPIQMFEPGSQDIQISEVPSPLPAPAPQPKTFKDIVMDFIAKTILHFKK